MVVGLVEGVSRVGVGWCWNNLGHTLSQNLSLPKNPQHAMPTLLDTESECVLPKKLRMRLFADPPHPPAIIIRRWVDILALFCQLAISGGILPLTPPEKKTHVWTCVQMNFLDLNLFNSW